MFFLIKQFFALACFLLLASGAFAVISHDSIKVFAVTEDGQTAMTADLGLTIENGTGRVWSSVEPLIGTSTQTTEKIAVQVAKNYFDKVSSYDYKFDINSSASLVDGPSAGAAMGLLTVSMLTDRQVPETVGITGTITQEGGVGAVGGVFKKAEEAARIGIKLFMIPQGEGKQVVKTSSGVESVNIVEYASVNWGMKIVEVGTIDQVILLAFSDIDKIDVNAGRAELPDFIPKGTGISATLLKMRMLNENYIKRSDDSIKNARKSLTGTLLNDPGLIDAMLTSLTVAEDDLQNAKILFDQNYLYSSANYAFLAQVNAMLVDDLSKNPSLTDSSSTVFELKVLDLKKEAQKFHEDLNDFVPFEDWEWHTAAQQRLSWAENKIDSLLGSKTIVIGITEGSQANSLDDLLDYEFAAAWLQVAKDFASLTGTSEKKVRSKPMFSEQIDSYVITAEKNILGQGDTDDIARRIATAKKSREIGWSSSALFDSASAFALSNAANFIKNKDLNSLETTLREKISEVEKGLEGKNFVWADLYLNHAEYYLQGIDFYKKQGLNSQALEMAQSGISIVFLAEATLRATETADAYYSSIPPNELLDNEPKTSPVDSTILDIIVFALIVSIIVIAAFFVLLRMQSSTRFVSDKKVTIGRAKARLDSLFANKKISHSEYIEMNTILEKRLHEIEFDKEALSQTTIKSDRMRFELQALKRTLLEMQRQKKSGIITAKDFEKSSGKIKSKIGFLEKALDEREKDIQAEKTKVKTDLKKYNAEAREMLTAKKSKWPKKKGKK